MSSDKDALDYIHNNIVLSSDDKSSIFVHGDLRLRWKKIKIHLFEYFLVYFMFLYSYCFWWVIPVIFIFGVLLIFYLIIYYLVFNIYFFYLEEYKDKKNLVRRNFIYDLFSKK